MEQNLQAGQAPLHETVRSSEASPKNRIRRLAGTSLKWLRPMAVAVCALFLALLVAGVSYQFFERRADALRFPQEGKSVDIGGYRLNINCKGQGSPTVILEAGLGVPAISWRAVQAGISQFTRVCSYDRAGYDWSDPGPMPRTAAQNVTELHKLLQNAGERPPYVLVGHSFGGAEVRIFANRYPGEVAGILLADTGNGQQQFPDYFQKLVEGDLRRRQRARTWAPLLYWSGISRLASRNVIGGPASTYDLKEGAYLALQPKFKAAEASEMENLEEGKNELNASGKLGNKPLIVLIAGDTFMDLALSPEEKAELNLSWIESEKHLAGLSSRGKWVMVQGADHMLPINRPDTIVSSARELCLGTPIS